jgi:hypothetical protein
LFFQDELNLSAMTGDPKQPLADLHGMERDDTCRKSTFDLTRRRIKRSVVPAWCQFRVVEWLSILSA